MIAAYSYRAHKPQPADETRARPPTSAWFGTPKTAPRRTHRATHTYRRIGARQQRLAGGVHYGERADQEPRGEPASIRRCVSCPADGEPADRLRPVVLPGGYRTAGPLIR